MRNYVAYKGITNGAIAFLEAPILFVIFGVAAAASMFVYSEKDYQLSKPQCEFAASIDVPTIGYCRVNGTAGQNGKIIVPKAYR